MRSLALNTKTNTDMRRSLITELVGRSNHKMNELESWNTGTHTLTGFVIISQFLLDRNVKNEKELSSMSYQNQRDALIDVISKSFNGPSAFSGFSLHWLGDSTLVEIAYATVPKTAEPKPTEGNIS